MEDPGVPAADPRARSNNVSEEDEIAKNRRLAVLNYVAGAEEEEQDQEQEHAPEHDSDEKTEAPAKNRVDRSSQQEETPPQPGAFAVLPDDPRGESAGLDLLDEIPINVDGHSDEIHNPDKEIPAVVVENEDFEAVLQAKMLERTVTASSVQNSNVKSTPQRSFKLSALCIVLFGVIFLGIAIAFMASSDKESGNETQAISPPSVDNDVPPEEDSVLTTSPPTPAPTVSDLERARDLLAPISGLETLTDESSPQYQALWWLVNEDPGRLPLGNLSDNDSLSTSVVERFVIALLYFATGGPDWILDLDFFTAASVCEWPAIREGEDDDFQLGVRCNDNGLVKYIRLDENNINGTVPSELSALKDLQKVSMFGDVLQGTLPSSLGDLALLSFFDVSKNDLTGTIPESYSKLRKLEYFRANSNDLTGTIPPGFYQILNLEDLGLENNALTGPIPESPLNGDIRKIDIGLNMLSGSLPESLSLMSKLEYVSMWDNHLNGTIPNLGSLTGLRYLDIEENQLTGTLPAALSALINLEDWYVSNNFFHGTLPAEYSSLGRLEYFWLHNNNFSGQVPVEWGDLSFKSLTLYYNNLTGDLDMFCNKTALFTVVRADCGGEEPQVDCPCCAKCCDNVSGECTSTLKAVCNIDALAYANEAGRYYEESRGTSCDCPGEGSNVTLMCSDTTCESCNRDGSVCATNYDYRAGFFESSGYWKYWKSTYQYTVGRNDTVTFEERWLPGFLTECEVTVNGEICGSCDVFECADGFSGFRVNCENVEGAGSVDLCDDVPDDTGPLTVFALQDPFYLSGCAPRFS